MKLILFIGLACALTACSEPGNGSSGQPVAFGSAPPAVGETPPAEQGTEQIVVLRNKLVGQIAFVGLPSEVNMRMRCQLLKQDKYDTAPGHGNVLMASAGEVYCEPLTEPVFTCAASDCNYNPELQP